MPKSKTINFEQKMVELDDLIVRIESGKLSLEEMMAEYEKGIRLSLDLSEQLNDAEKKLQKLSDGKLVNMEEE